jgi:hypothetical protein
VVWAGMDSYADRSKGHDLDLGRVGQISLPHLLASWFCEVEKLALVGRARVLSSEEMNFASLRKAH